MAPQFSSVLLEHFNNSLFLHSEIQQPLFSLSLLFSFLQSLQICHRRRRPQRWLQQRASESIPIWHIWSPGLKRFVHSVTRVPYLSRRGSFGQQKRVFNGCWLRCTCFSMSHEKWRSWTAFCPRRCSFRENEWCRHPNFGNSCIPDEEKNAQNIPWNSYLS